MRNEVIGWVTDPYPKIIEQLEIIGEDEYDEIRLGVDTGSVRSLLSEEIYNVINCDYTFQLQAHGIQFEAVNGTKIECIGYVKLPVLFYGYEKNYVYCIISFNSVQRWPSTCMGPTRRLSTWPWALF